MRSGWRCSGRPVSRSLPCWIGTRCFGRSAPRRRSRSGAGSTRSCRASSSTSTSIRRTSRPIRRPGPVARTYAAYEAEIRRRGGLDFDDLVARALRLLEGDAGGARRLARALHAPARRRGPGPRPGPAPPGAAARGAGEPDLPRRRRRPVDLRLAARRRAPAPRPGRGIAAGTAPGRPRDQLPLPGAGPRARRSPRRAQRRTIREGHPRPAGCRRAACPRAVGGR